MAYVDLFEQSSSPPEKNIRWPKTEHKMAKNGWKLSKVAITGSTRSLLAKSRRYWVLANQIRPTLSAAIVFRVHPFLAKKYRELPFLAIAQIKMPDGWRTIKSVVHKIRLYGRRGKGMAESFSTAERRGMRNKSCVTFLLCDPGWYIQRT